MSCTEMGTLERLRATHLWRWAVLYGAAAITATQLIEPIDRAFGPFPEPLLRAVLVLLGAGFPMVLILAWFHGEQGRQRVTRLEALALTSVVAATTAVLALTLRSTEASASPRLPNPQEFGVAVMPFEHLGHPDDRARTRGIFAAVSDGLLQVSGLTPIDRSATSALPDSIVDGTRIAEILGVRYLLFGEVQWADRLSTRTLVRLVDGRSGLQLDNWEIPARYDSAEAVFAIQESIAGHVARAVGARVLAAEEKGLAELPTADALAMDQYLLAVAELGRAGLDPDAMQAALAHLERAVERDGRYGEAWARLAYLRAMAASQFGGSFAEGAPILIDEALVAAERYAPGSYETMLARASVTYLSLSDRDLVAAERRLSDLVRRYPASAEGRAMLGFLLRRLDQWPRAIEELEAALVLDPMNLQNLVLTSEALHMVGRFHDAIEVAGRAEALDATGSAAGNRVLALLWGLADTVAVAEFVESHPGEGGTLWAHQTLLELRGDWEGAVQQAERMPGQPPWVLAALHRKAGNPATARMWADSGVAAVEARLSRCPGPGVPSPCRQRWLSELGLTLAVAGDTADALAELAGARSAHDAYHDGYMSTAFQSMRVIAYAELGRWPQGMEEVRALLSRPSYMHAAFMKIAPQFQPLRAARPDFTKLLDSIVEARGPDGLLGGG